MPACASKLADAWGGGQLVDMARQSDRARRKSRYQRSTGRRRISLTMIASRTLAGSRSMTATSCRGRRIGDGPGGSRRGVLARVGQTAHLVTKGMLEVRFECLDGLLDLLGSGPVGEFAIADRIFERRQRAPGRPACRDDSVASSVFSGRAISGLRAGMDARPGGIAGAAGRFSLAAFCWAARRRNSPTSSSTRCFSAGGCGGFTRAVPGPWPAGQPAIRPPAPDSRSIPRASRRRRSVGPIRHRPTAA